MNKVWLFELPYADDSAMTKAEPANLQVCICGSSGCICGNNFPIITKSVGAFTQCAQNKTGGSVKKGYTSK